MDSVKFRLSYYTLIKSQFITKFQQTGLQFTLVVFNALLADGLQDIPKSYTCSKNPFYINHLTFYLMNFLIILQSHPGEFPSTKFCSNQAALPDLDSQVN